VSRAPDPFLVAARAVVAPLPPRPAPLVVVQPLPVERVAAPPPKAETARAVVAAKPAPVTRKDAKTSYYVQAGAYGTAERAGRIAQDLDRLGARVSPANIGGHAIYRVRIGPFLDVEQASTAIAHAKQMGHADLKIVLE
jgi:cell division protein FtsN